ncbi:sarcosine oxidase [Pseudonocardia endophytica]|uniref:Sarcosine oxidase n=1 Tax=Pseudonocardia endophytica TaxID=401976 RepID=A0A4R1I093_PSEEN|nr:sarcosine oxidase [Pseudonocardia endophytica]
MVGAGVVGMSTAAALVAAGEDVLVFESSDVVMGERSAGSSRIFRLAHTDPELVRYASRARTAFDGWSTRAGTPLLDPCGCVVSGTDAPDRARAMASAGAPHSFDLADGTLPTRSVEGPVLVDPSGGVLDVDGVRRLLSAEVGTVVHHERVTSIDEGTVSTPDGIYAADTVVVAAGADTPALALPVGIELPQALEHHVRFTFALPDDGPVPAWIDASPGRVSTYQHRTGPGRWSVGATLPSSLVSWENGQEAASVASERAVVEYATEHLTVDPAVLDRLYCTHAPDTGDGILFRRSGPVLAVYGENLMKFAPVLGETLAAAARDGSTPPDLG